MYKVSSFSNFLILIWVVRYRNLCYCTREIELIINFVRFVKFYILIYIFIIVDFFSIVFLFLFVYFYFILRYVCIRCDFRCDYNKALLLSLRVLRGVYRLLRDRRWCKLFMYLCFFFFVVVFSEIRWTDRYWWEVDYW